MPRSPKLTKGETAKLTKVQNRGLQKASDAVADAADKVDALKTKKRAKHEEVQRWGCHALERHCFHHPALREQAGELGAVEVVVSALDRFAASHQGVRSNGPEAKLNRRV